MALTRVSHLITTHIPPHGASSVCLRLMLIFSHPNPYDQNSEKCGCKESAALGLDAGSVALDGHACHSLKGPLKASATAKARAGSELVDAVLVIKELASTSSRS